MERFSIEECTLKDIETLRDIGEATFSETFSHNNTEENMEKYLYESFSYEQIKSEIEKDGSKFFIIKDKK
ncbi:MAG: GNAT family N-acetyltransferase, partial [Clostridium sp.]|nr:GNAT family N-acetyltransferase [Clostridium sp.]